MIMDHSFTLTSETLDTACTVVYKHLSATPQYVWPLLAQRLGMTAWVKHENHLPVGAFKVRGGLTYVDALLRNGDKPAGLLCATRGNHGQSIAFAGALNQIPVTIVVPHGNSSEKNAAMRALGATLIEHGDDFQAAKEYAQQIQKEQNLHFVPSIDPRLIAGVATGWAEFFKAVTPDVVFVPIGQGSGFSAAAAVRNLFKLKTKLIGVVSAHANGYQESFRQKRPVTVPTTTELADGLACSTPDPQGLDVVWRESEDVVAVTDAEVAEAIRILFADTHNAAEGAGAAALAATIAQKERWQGKTVGVPITGGNIDAPLFANVLSGNF